MVGGNNKSDVADLFLAKVSTPEFDLSSSIVPQSHDHDHAFGSGCQRGNTSAIVRLV